MSTGSRGLATPVTRLERSGKGRRNYAEKASLLFPFNQLCDDARAALVDGGRRPKQVLLDVWCEQEQVHELRNPGARHVA